MNNQDILQIIMIGILLLCGYIFLFQIVAKRTENKSAIPFVAIVLLLIYVLIAAPVVFIISRMGNTSMILMAILLLFACVVLFAALYGLIHNFREINKGALALLLVYLLAVAYVTIFSRDTVRTGSAGGVYMFRFDLIEQAVRTRSLEPVNHLLLNVAMFVPLGFLLPFVDPDRLARWYFALMAGLLFTTIIEFTQMMLRIGQADGTDMVTNTLGAVLGYLLYRVIRLIRSGENDDE
ncbi:MAG: VanZ family protein [Clostridia bacterium]|nr:VanZ family protein [Clostridia bacterium]